MDEQLLKANAAKALQALGLAGGTIAMMSSGHVSVGSWQGAVGAVSTLVSFGFMIYDTFVVKAKVEDALYTAPPGTVAVPIPISTIGGLGPVPPPSAPTSA